MIKKDVMDALCYIHSLARTVPNKEGVCESFRQVCDYIEALEVKLKELEEDHIANVGNMGKE